MKAQNSHTPILTEIALITGSTFEEDYASVLIQHGLEYQAAGNYLKVGRRGQTSGWVLHISIIRQQMVLFLNSFLAKYIPLRFSFTIPANGSIHTMILDGSFGYAEIGKIMTIYLPDQESALSVTNMLIELTKAFVGPEVPTAYNLGGNIYTDFIKELVLDQKVNWPFKNIKSQKQTQPKRWIGRYLIINQLKGDAKGNVYKCLNLNNWSNIHWCVVKQGRAYQCSDDFGRNIKDRLEWQYKLLNDFDGNVSVSKPLDYFEYKNDAYMVIEYIDGSHLYDKINQLHNGTMWLAMPVTARRELIRILMAVIELVDKFHDQGLIHRDINPGNFLIRNDGSIVGIDIELAYSYSSNDPRPPFAFGTPGYMSPQQMQYKTPCLEDDYYGLGGLMVKIFTGMSPSKFQGNNEETLFTAMKFHIGNNEIASLISRCLNHNPDSRPKIKSIQHTLFVYDALLLTCLNTMMPEPQIDIHPQETKELKAIIQKALNAFGTSIMTDQFGHWIGKTAQIKNNIANEFRNYETKRGFANGTEGVFYMLANAAKLGFDLGQLNIPITRNLEFIKNTEAANPNQSCGLFFGSPGTSVALTAMIDAGLLEKNIYHHNLIYKGLTQLGTGINLATGDAGRGLAILYCATHSNQQIYYQELNTIVNRIIKEQQREGAWLIKRDNSDKKGIKVLGFTYGIAGILYFLMIYYSKYNDSKVKESILKGLNWLLTQRVISDGNLLWPLNSKNGIIDPWVEDGFSGVAFTFIKAYEIFREETFKEAATDALLSHPKYISSNYITSNKGLVGLGYVYVEAYKILLDESWKDRARYIVYQLIYCCKTDLDENSYWLEGNSTLPTAGYLDGNAGIINFLVRYLFPEKIEWPF